MPFILINTNHRHAVRSVINNTMLPQITILAWVFLGESLTGRQVTGLVLVSVGTLVVQLRPRRLISFGKASTRS